MRHPTLGRSGLYKGRKRVTVRAPKQASKVDGRHGYSDKLPRAPGSVMDHIDLSTIFMIMLAAAFIVAAVVFYERGRHPRV